MAFVWFIAGFDDLSYDLKAERQEDVKRLVADARTIVERKEFAFAPIDLERIEALVPNDVQSVDKLAAHLESIKQNVLCEKFKPFVRLTVPPEAAAKMGDPVDLAWAYYVNRLFRQIHPARTPAQFRTDKKEVRLAADYNGWVLVKKVNLSLAKDKEVLGGLVGMHQTLIDKVPELCSPGFSQYEEILNRILSVFPERKSFARIPKILRAIDVPELQNEDAELEEYALMKALARGGFPPYVSTELFSSLYPELKIPKPRGNYGGKRKKK